MQGSCSQMPLSSLQKKGGAQECSRQATSDRDGPEDLGSVSSLLGVATVVPPVFADLLQPETPKTRQHPTTPNTHPGRRMPSIWER